MSRDLISPSELLLRVTGVWIIILFWQPANSQELEISFTRVPDQMTLPMISGMDQDERGYLWMSAQSNGLIRYDGNEFKKFSPGASNDLGFSAVQFECITVDPAKGIWSGDFINGLFFFDPDTEQFTHFQHDPKDKGSLSNNEIRALLRDSRGTLWIGTRVGLDTLERKTGQFHHVRYNTQAGEHLNQAHIRSLYEDSDGMIWVGCGSPHGGDDLVPESNGLYRLDIPNGSITRYIHNDEDTTTISDNRVRAIFEDSRGVFWIGTAGEDGLHTMNRETGQFRQYRFDPDHPEKLSRPPIASYDDLITFINEDSEGFIWIGTLVSGMNRFDPVSRTVQHFGTEATGNNEVDRNDHWVSLLSRDGTLWVSSNWNTSRIERRLLRIQANPARLPFKSLGRVVASFYEDTDETLWIGTSTGLDKFDREGKSTTFLNNHDIPNSPENAIPYIEGGPPDLLFLSTFNGLYIFNTRTNQSERVEFSHKNVSVRVTQYNEDGTLWIGSAIGLDLLSLETGEVQHFHSLRSNYNTPEDSLKIRNGEIRSIAVDKQGNTWIAGYSGLYRVTPDRKFLETILPGPFSESRVFVDSDDDIWLSAERNMFLFNKERSSLELMTGLEPHSSLAAPTLMFEYKPGELWIKCGNGFITYNKPMNVARYFGESWFQFPLIDRMICKTSNEEILVGTNFAAGNAGYHKFKPSDFEKNNVQVKPFYFKVFYRWQRTICKRRRSKS